MDFHHKPTFLLWALALAGLLVLYWNGMPVRWSGATDMPEPPAGVTLRGPIQPIPAVVPQDPRKVALGQALFHDTRLSADESLSCASCHLLDAGGHDPRRVSLGVGGAQGVVNAPSVFNASFNFVQFWDGRAATLEEQAHGPITNGIEMAASWDQVLARLRADVAFRARFRAVYPQGLTPETVVDAIAAFERTLVTPGAPFDRYLGGDEEAIDSQAKRGYQIFKEAGCISCHQGVNVGGNLFQRFGILGDYFADRGPAMPVQPADYGRFNVTGQERDRFVFKVPGLRNVGLTAPYFHDGFATSLAEAIAIMGRYQLGRDLSQDEIESIQAFLHSLTAPMPEQASP